MSACTQRPLSGWVVASSWVVTAALFYFFVGPFVGELVEGIDASQVPRALACVSLLALLISLFATAIWARRLGTKTTDASQQASGLGRRRFLAGALGSVGGLVGTAIAMLIRPLDWLTVTTSAVVLPEVPSTDPNPRQIWEGARIKEYRRLGRTGFAVSDISLGSMRITRETGGEALAREAIERGVNYFDTAPDYAANGSELTLGRAMRGYREQMFVATKFCTADGHLRQGSSVADYLSAVEGSLKRLQTDYVDLVHIHACNSIERLMDPNAHEAFDRLKEQGKVRFLGVSSHAPNLELVANAALESGRFDVMMLAYNHGVWPELGAVIDRAASQDVGIVAMKTLKGAKHEGLLEFRDEADTYAQAAFKWVLANPSVSCLVISFSEPQHIDEYLYASGKRPTEHDRSILRKYNQLTAGKHCFQHCGACLDSCPERLAIDDVLRYRMYFEDYGDQKQAMRLYAKLDKKSDSCLGCGAPCSGTCPHGVSIQQRLIGAHKMLSLS